MEPERAGEPRLAHYLQCLYRQAAAMLSCRGRTGQAGRYGVGRKGGRDTVTGRPAAGAPGPLEVASGPVTLIAVPTAEWLAIPRRWPAAAIASTVAESMTGRRETSVEDRNLGIRVQVGEKRMRTDARDGDEFRAELMQGADDTPGPRSRIRRVGIDKGTAVRDRRIAQTTTEGGLGRRAVLAVCSTTRW